MLASAAPEPFDSPAHIFEVLWEGVRALAFIERGELRLQDRWGRDITARYPELREIPARVRESGVVIDGAIVCLDGDGRPDLLRLSERLGQDGAAADEAAERWPVTFQAFDLLYRERQPLTGWTLRRRKEMLRGLTRPNAAIAVPDDVARDGIAFFEAAREHGLLGIVAKETESRYQPGERSRAWLSVLARNQGEFVIGGYTYGGRWDPRGASRQRREAFASLLVGLVREDGSLDYAGEVTGGFQLAIEALLPALDDATTAECPFAEAPALERLVFWCRPEVVATIGFAEWTPGGRLRFPVFRALRPDVPPYACHATRGV
jgi:bifunctional non-homologous end joining protein LigD